MLCMHCSVSLLPIHSLKLENEYAQAVSPAKNPSRSLILMPTPYAPENPKQIYLRMDDALRLRRSAFWALASLTRLARIAAYSFYTLLEVRYARLGRKTYSSILCSLSIAALERDAVALVLETLGSNQSLDLGSLGIRLLALALGLDFTTNNKFADLNFIQQNFVSALIFISHSVPS